MFRAGLGLVLSVVLALTGSVIALQRVIGEQGTNLAAGESGAGRPYACHDAIRLAHEPAPAPQAAAAGPVRAAPPVKAVAAPTPTTALAGRPPSLPVAGTAAAPTGAGCHPTPEQVAAANKLLEDTRNAISARYASVSQATVDGFQPATNDNSTNSRVMHYTREANRHDGRTADPEHAEGLLYGRTDHHGIILLGAFYLAEDGKPPPDVGGCVAAWHVHHAGGPMLHVWIVDMPGGPFANDWDASYIANL